jgi:hypothetical protein
MSNESRRSYLKVGKEGGGEDACDRGRQGKCGRRRRGRETLGKKVP